MEKMYKIKDILLEHIYTQVTENIDCVDTKELGEAVDMIKDLAEAIYYHTVTEAMHHTKHEDKSSEEMVVKK